MVLLLQSVLLSVERREVIVASNTSPQGETFVSDMIMAID